MWKPIQATLHLIRVFEYVLNKKKSVIWYSWSNLLNFASRRRYDWYAIPLYHFIKSFAMIIFWKFNVGRLKYLPVRTPQTSVATQDHINKNWTQTRYRKLHSFSNLLSINKNNNDVDWTNCVGSRKVWVRSGRFLSPERGAVSKGELLIYCWILE